MENRRHSQDDTPSGDGYFGREDEKPSGQEETTPARSDGEAVGKAQDDAGFEYDDEAEAEEEEADRGRTGSDHRNPFVRFRCGVKTARQEEERTP